MGKAQIDRIKVQRDGTHLFVTMDDFINLVESPAVFFGPDDWQYKILQPWVDGETCGNALDHLPLVEIFSILRQLTREEMPTA